MCELLVGLPDVDVVGVESPAPGWLIVNVAAREDRPACGGCGTSAWVKDYRDVDLVDLAAFDQRVVLRVTRTRWCCPIEWCPLGSWTLEHLDIAPAGQKLTTRAGRWAMADGFDQHLNRIIQRALKPGPYLYAVGATGLELRWAAP